ncbi:MAG: exodeoxyribonuclease VII large subunit, partial [Arcobacter sp.]|nr:exodeoxyribonuclease VII large subunit [Arcobacter sp.]
DKAIKKQLPIYPKNIYVVTSNTGAAIEDMKKILTNRYPLAKMILIPTLVQGSDAKNDIARSIKLADSLASKTKDNIIIVGRGGGSIEDLWAFNEEIVADAIFNSITPIISAVGHENDFVISDFVADSRASTPSNAIEMATPNINDLIMYVDNLKDELSVKMKIIFKDKQSRLENIQSLFAQHSFKKRFLFISQNIFYVKNQQKQLLEEYQNKLDFLKQNFTNHHPDKKINKGFVQVTNNNQIINIDNCNAKDDVTLETAKYKFTCKILEKSPNY